jgi:ABC-type uncharacterized transport system substrate-binding protein
MRRRDFINLVGGAAAAWSVAARAQSSKAPVIGFLRSGSSADSAPLVAAFRQGLNELGYIEGQNLVIEYRWAEGHYDRLSALAVDLVERRVAVLVATGGDASVDATLAATTTVPIVFIASGDPVASGWIASFNRPGGNATGVNMLATFLDGKRLDVLHELLPDVGSFGILLHRSRGNLTAQKQELREAARTIGRHVEIVEVESEQEFDTAFASFVGRHIGALVVGASAYFFGRREQLVAQAARHALPAIYEWRDFVEAGGLMSYGTDIAKAYRLAGAYAGRILKGEKPADMPIQQSTEVELVINLKTAKALGLTIPPSLLARADEVIE